MILFHQLVFALILSSVLGSNPWLFQSDGRILSSIKAKQQAESCSTLCFGCRCSDGVLLLTRNKMIDSKKALSKVLDKSVEDRNNFLNSIKQKRLMISSSRWLKLPKKVHRITDNIFVLLTGIHSDSMQLLSTMRNISSTYQDTYGDEIYFEKLVQELSTRLWDHASLSDVLLLTQCMIGSTTGQFCTLEMDGTFHLQSVGINIDRIQSGEPWTEEELASFGKNSDNSPSEDNQVLSIPFDLQPSQYQRLHEWITSLAKHHVSQPVDDTIDTLPEEVTMMPYLNKTCREMKTAFLNCLKQGREECHKQKLEELGEIVTKEEEGPRITEESLVHGYESIFLYFNGTSYYESF